MNYAHFDPYLIRERNERLHQEMGRWRLEKQLRGDRRGPSGLWLVDLTRGWLCQVPLLRAAAGLTALVRERGVGGDRGW